MKRALFLLPGAIAVMFAAAPMISGFHNVAIVSPAYAGEGHGGHGEHGEHGALNKLNLTPEQKAQIQKIRASAKQQTDTVFTADQRAQLQQARQKHTRPQLNLTDDQKAQLKQIHESTESQINAVLTTQQQQQLQQIRAQHHQQHSS